jgi:HEAT repeat protein
MARSEIAQALLRRQVATDAAIAQAEQRQQLYVGSLDTALLELGACDEATLITHLGEIVGGRALPPARFHALPQLPDLPPWGEATARELGALPLARADNTLEVWLRPLHDRAGLVAWAEAHALSVEPFLVTEARFLALMLRCYGQPIAARYLALLAKLMGASEIRRWLTLPRRPSPRPGPGQGAGAGDAGADPVAGFVAAARLGDEPARKSALHYLAGRLTDPRVVELRRALVEQAHAADPAAARAALQALAQLRDKNAVPAIIDLVLAPDQAVAVSAQATLRALTCADFGRKRKAWLDFWAEKGSQPRLEWLLDGLAHETAEIRLAAESELYQISSDYFGYHFDLPEREREEARRRWTAWWRRQG